jgi:hypothetical protein
MNIRITLEQANLLRALHWNAERTDMTTDAEDKSLADIIAQIDRLTPSSDSRKITYKCRNCDEAEGWVYWDSTTQFDDETQSYESDGDPSGDSFCGNCGAEDSALPYDIETGEELRAYYGDKGHEYMTVAQWEEAQIADRLRYAQKQAEAEALEKALETANLLALDMEVSE